ncbi:MAG TPA: sodium:proton antiporter [Variovorax sp.]|nr:sodium:proton antiporter [Variovorax sp.]
MAGGHAGVLDGAALSPLWGVPFAGLLLSIALLPLFAPAFWHRHDGKVVLGWVLAFMLPFTIAFGLPMALEQFVHAALAEYVPFIVLLTALFTVAGGIHVSGNLRGAPGLNVAILALGAVLASVMGTTGASMLLIRPLIRANDDRVRCAHVVVFFIFIVSNVGGALTPLGDPPLFLGFLKGVDFFWTVRHLLPQTLCLLGVLLALFWVVDRHLFRVDGVRPVDPTPDTPVPTTTTGTATVGRWPIGIEGARNFWLLAGVIGLVLMSGTWRSPIAFDVMGTPVGLPGLLRDVGLLALTGLSLAWTPRRVHAANRFGWAPMAEVGTLFAGIFLTIVPVIAMLKAGAAGPFGAVVSAVTRADGQPDPAMYFWATGLLSSFLDNAPTYLVFFNTAGGDAATLMTTHAATLAAISAGAVFMGANTYIGNAPNLMVKAIAEDRGVRMPGFFGFMAWSLVCLVPLFVLVTVVFVR